MNCKNCKHAVEEHDFFSRPTVGVKCKLCDCVKFKPDYKTLPEIQEENFRLRGERTE